MRKIISAILTTTMVFSSMAFTALAHEDAPVDESHIMLISLDEETEAVSKKITYNGTIEEAGEGYITLKDTNLQFNYDDNTVVANYDFEAAELKSGDVVTVIADTIQTRSIPAQSYAYNILVNHNNSQATPIYVKVASNNGEEILSADGANKVIISDETPTKHQSAKIRLMAKDITVGSEILVFASVIGLSLPAYVPAEKIVVTDLAEIAIAEDETIDEIVAARPEMSTITYNGTVEEAGEGYITLKDTDLQFNYDNNSVVADYDFIPASVKAGDVVTVVADTIQTKSIPAQSYAYYILINQNDAQTSPIYVKVGSNNGEEILSEDGTNKVVYTDATPTKHHSAKIRLMAKDITVGSEMFVFANVVGMSIPAHVAADRIVVMNMADEAETDIDTIVVDDEVYAVAFNFFKDEAFATNPTARFSLRTVCEGLGYDVAWNGETQSIEITSGDKTITMDMKASVARNGNNPIIIDGTTYVTGSLFKVLYGEDADVQYQNNTITVKTNK